VPSKDTKGALCHIIGAHLQGQIHEWAVIRPSNLISALLGSPIDSANNEGPAPVRFQTISNQS
jgi:hypothetical protein